MFIFLCVLYYTFRFLMRLSHSVYLSVYRKIIKDVFLHFLKMSQKCEQFSYEIVCCVFLCFFEILGS